ncbi:LamG-like jellyroll fold domain-containing protein [Bradyrhizobium japonicum]|uniref:LamG-like jellyroll fold domain-containing protein n=1 Tax=Bradyrhizobium japonicum TaxID=375 RepID=UPI001BAC9DEB|nr:LamG-like jellyroll fold domain-containing protein [Bradyrhizobium japonicum]MBR0960891.1 VCBS repeat-containing protein [Bradyrhizobium japonicum]
MGSHTYTSSNVSLPKLTGALAIFCITILSPVGPAFATTPPPPTASGQAVFTSESTAARVDGATGAFTQHIPIDIPPGRNGLQPSLSLDYNSQNTDQDSIVGYGWSLSIPYIQRLNKTGSQDMYGPNAYFASSLDGELAPLSTSTSSTVSTSSVAASLVSYWKLDESSGNASDSAGSNALTPQGSATYATGKINNAGSTAHSGSAGYFLKTSPSGLYPTGDFTVQAWLNPASNITSYSSGSLFGILGVSGQQYRFWWRNVGGVATLVGAPGSGSLSVAQSFTPGTWYHFVAVYTASSGKLEFFINGTSIGSSTGNSVGTPSGDFFVGNNFNSEIGNDWDGKIDEVAVWNRALSPTEISQLYNGGSGLAYPLSVTSTTTNSQISTYGARIDDGSFHSYTYATSTNSWTMYDKNGTRYLFGASSQSEQSATTSPSNVYKWMLEEVRDTNGNYIKYTYHKDGNQIFPYQIIYTGNGSTDGPATITIATSTRSDVVTSYRPGFAETTSYRISSITAAFNGSNVRQYNLSYTVGNNGTRSLLSSVQETGWNDAGTQTTLPPTLFGYDSTTTPFYTPGPSGGGGGGVITSPAQVVTDVNGNGINDTTVFYVDSFGQAHGTVLADGASPPSVWTANVSAAPDYWSSGVSSASCPNGPPALIYERGVRFLDINGDGKADVVTSFHNYTTGADTTGLYLNTYATSTGYGWTSMATGTIPTFGEDGSGSIHGLTAGIFGDVNGTGLPSFEQSVTSYFSPTAYLANGSGWNAGTTTIFAPAQSFPTSVESTPTNSQLLDVNGDGLADWVYSDANKTYALLNNGRGWNTTADPAWTISTSTLFAFTNLGVTSYYDRGIRFFDVNGDGLPDMIHSYSGSGSAAELATYSQAFLNTGHGWATSTAYTFPATITTSSSSGNFCNDEYENWTGNGQMDQDALSTVTLPKGGSTTVTYGYTAQSSKNPQLPYSLLTVTKLINHDGRGSNEETDYSYSGGLQYLPTNVFDRKFGGFASTTESRSDRTVVTYFNQGDATTTSLGEQSDGFAQINHPFRKETFTPAGTAVQKFLYRWDAYPHASSTFVALGRQLEFDYASDGSHRDKDTDYKYSSTTDDLIETDNYGEVTGNSDGTFTDVSGDSRTTLITYAASSSVNLSVPTKKTVLNNTGATTTDTKLYYDTLPFGSIGAGNQTRQEDWVSGTHYASSTKSYNSYGLVTQSTDRNGNATTYSYDSFNLYPATSTNTLSQSTGYAYNYSNGKPKQSTDPNGAIAKTLFDGVGRITEIDQSDVANPSSLVTKSTFQFTDSTTTPPSVHESDYLTSATTTDTFDYYDGLSRLIQERKSSENSGTYTTTDSTYSTAGLLASQSLPYFSSGSSNTSATSTRTLYATYTYDPLGRKTMIGTAVGTTTNAYAKWSTTTTDPNGNVKDYTTDAYGNLAQVVEHISPSNATTNYLYDAANNLIKITDALGNIRNFTYDGISNRLSAEDLHASGAGSFGTWSYSYDDQGNEISRTDPKSQTTTHTYDALNRPLTESWTGHGTQVTNTYDSCQNGIGRLCSASSTAALSSSAYDVLGRTTGATTTIGGVAYDLSSAYDRQGNVTSVTNANGSQLSYGYNLAGLVNGVSRTNAGTTTRMASLLNYAATNQLGLIAFASGASTTYSYNPAALYRLSEILTQSPASTTTYPISSTLTSSLASYWKFDESSGHASDSVGSNSLSPQGGGYVAGKLNNAGSFGHTNGYFLKSSPSGLYPTGDFTVQAWLNPSSQVTSYSSGSIFGIFGVSGQQYRLWWRNIGGTPKLEAALGSGSLSVAQSFTTGTWYHFVAVYTAATGKIEFFVNGASVGSSSGNSVGTPSGDFFVGNNTNSEIGNDWDGKLDEVAVWNRALSSVDISQLYNAGAGQQYPFSAGSATTTRNVKLQDLSYGYDAAGNIVSRADNSDTALGQQITYAYDAFNRLTSASSTGGYLPSYNQTYAYDLLGNMTTGPAGTYTYGGGSGANPDAVTQTVLTTGASAPTIAYDNSTLSGIGVPASSLTFSHTTNNNTNGLIVIAVAEATTTPCTSDTVTGVTDNGSALSDFGYYVRNTTTIGGALKTYYGFAPAQGTHNIVVSASASCILYAVASTYTGVKQSGVPDASGSGNPLSDSGAVSLFQATTTTSGINSWGVLVGVPSISGTATAGSNTTIRQQQSGKLYYADSNGPVSPAGSIGLNWTIPGTSHWLANYFSIPAFASNPGSSATTTYTYDLNGNVTAVGTSTTYSYDYANRMVQSVVGGVTTNYGYDAFGSRVSQISGSTSTFYPNKFYSLTTTTGATTTATSTEYAFAGDTLLATVDQRIIGGTATGTPILHFIHPDNLGSTGVISDASGTASELLDYYPYGATRVDTNTAGVSEGRKFIGQFSEQSGLSYLNARYYDSQRGQFLSQDPVFLSSSQLLRDPQSLNAYSYSDGNPITKSDPNGKQAAAAISYGTGYFLGSESGPFDAIVGTAIGTALFTGYTAYSNSADGAPGFGPLQEMVQQNAYRSDLPEGPITPPPSWGTVGKIILASSLISEAGCTLLNCDLDGGTQATVHQSGIGSALATPTMVNNLYSPTVSGVCGSSCGNSSHAVMPQTSYATHSSGTYSNAGTTYSSKAGQGGSTPVTYPGGTIFPVAPELHAIVPH